jgi:serine/threonine-protein kinase
VNALEGGGSVGRYRIVKFLGAGAMGEVYLAEDPQIDRRLAIKTVRLAGRPQEIEERKRRLLREARAAGRLLHPNVVTLFDTGEAEGLLYLAFEFVEGTDLAARFDAGERPSLREVLRIVRQAAEALEYAHGQGIVHRDVKPSNILLDRSGRVKVADFGIAKMAGQSTELTMAGSVMGSPQYLSPEQIRGEELDGRSDIFSLGVVFYELLSGKRPFDGDTITTLVYQILHKDPPPVSELRAVPPRLEELLRRMLAKDRDERIATAGEVAWELAAIEGELADETLSAPVGTIPFEATKVLPRRTTGAAPAVPPPPPAVRSTLGTVPAAPATTPSLPPLPPAVPAAPAQATAPAGPKRSLLWISIAAALLMIAVLAGAGYVLSRPRTPPPTAQAAPDLAAPVSTPAGAAESAAPATVPPSTAAPVEQQTSSPPPVAAAPVPGVRQEPPPSETKQPDRAGPQTAQPVAPSQEPSPRLPDRPRPQDRVPGPAASEPAAPSPESESPAAPEPSPAPSAPPAALQQADQVIRTGLKVAFRVIPPDAHVLVDRTVIGTAGDWSGAKGARTYDFPGPGTYFVKIRKQGMKDYKIAVEAEARGGVTPIVARLQPLAAADVDAADLQTVRVREAIALRVQPPGAGVLVDGQPVGLARRFSGGGLLRGKGEWLELTPGRHRVSIVSPGFQRQDILVEVTETAERDRERIDVVLARGGGGE